MVFWTVPPIWSGQTVCIMASGPSMSQAVADAVHKAGVPTITVNSTWRLAPWAAMLYAADEEWWRHESNRNALSFAGLKVSVAEVPGVLRLRNSGTVGFDPEPFSVRTGGNSGYQALHVAIHAGAARVLLCGFDMQETGGETHWHGEHGWGLRRTPTPTFERWCERFAALVPELQARGVDVINCTPRSALTCFSSKPLAEALSCAVIRTEMHQQPRRLES